MSNNPENLETSLNAPSNLVPFHNESPAQWFSEVILPKYFAFDETDQVGHKIDARNLSQEQLIMWSDDVCCTEEYRNWLRGKKIASDPI